ncbi:hypothetical protein [Syntrophothermus lipocalidus]|uniref:CARDB domain-containing protein n=1 Tax=Syntrophothermus lipocalidus (strain DSM 12680 / TGB-C1) TaxID=643648 RepID=D7CQ02_SYNLT|nr:hypothetical protein [Syntrophothermus lipocalidus]ADI02780.1 hypothetical protein Slip_2033 [Syntrophothermus lipocalidus DSM 12680]
MRLVKKSLNCLLAAAMLLAVFVMPVRAVVVGQNGVMLETVVQSQTEDLYVDRDMKTGVVRSISYDIASTYSTAGIRYRTTAVTIQFPGIPGEVIIPVKDQLLTYNQALKSSPGFKYGQTYYSQVTISRDAIINAAPEQYRETVKKALDNPEAVGTVKTGAHIEIYDVKTDKVLAVLTSPEDVLRQTIMPQHRADMVTRWQNLDLTAGKRIQAVQMPDISVRSDKDVYTGAPGSTVNIIVAVKNEGNIPTVTDFGARWQSDDWSKKIFSRTNINLNPGDDPHYTIPVTVPTTEKKLVLRANIDGNTPPNEATLDNNTKVVTIKPAQVDLKVTITPVRNPVPIAWNSSHGKITANVQVTRKDSGEPVPARLTITGPGGTKTLNFTSIPGQAYGNYYTFDRAVPGTYTITAEVWPTQGQDANPADNKASCQIQVIKKQAPITDVPREPDIHGELGGM